MLDYSSYPDPVESGDFAASYVRNGGIIWFVGRQVTDEFVAQRLSDRSDAITSIAFNLTLITDKSIELLSALPGLKVLWVFRSPITPSSTDFLIKCKPLNQLHFVHCDIRDSSVPAIVDCPAVKSVALNSCPVTDASLCILSDMGRLEYLAFRRLF